MAPDDVRAYKRRWELLAEMERQEVQRMSPAQKLADQAMLMGVARALGGAADDEEDEETEQVRRRWVLLAERLGRPSRV